MNKGWLLFFGGLFYMFGSIGAAELERISLKAFVMRMVIGLILTAIGWLRLLMIYKEY